MTLLDVAAWIAMVDLLAVYALVARRPQHIQRLNQVNLWAGIVLACYGVEHHAYATAALSAAYCLIALWALVWRR